MPLEYPNIDCPDHPGIIEPGYLICDHLKSFLDIAYLELATKKQLGIMICAECSELDHDNIYCDEHLQGRSKMLVLIT